MKVNEPAISYNSSYIQGLKNRLIAFIDMVSDESKLEQCLEVLHRNDMPCCFSATELDEEIRLSEASGIATDKEVEAMFAQWKH